MTKEEFLSTLEYLRETHMAGFWARKKKAKAGEFGFVWVGFHHHDKDFDDKYLALLKKASKEDWFSDANMINYRKDLELMRGC